MVNRKLDEQERLIIRALIKNPRRSDNQISKLTEVPVMSVNRKRKAMEKEGLLLYMARLVHGPSGVGTQICGQLYIVKFKIGMTANTFVEGFKHDPSIKANSEYITSSYLASYEGHLALVILLGGFSHQQITDIFHGQIVPSLQKQYGEDIIVDIFAIPVTIPLRLMHNYMPLVNIENGHIKDSWRDEWIFVD